MQTIYKTLSSYEYDFASQSFKRVEKESEIQLDDFLDALSLAKESGFIEEQMGGEVKNLQEENFKNSGANLSAYADMSSIYSYRFSKQNLENSKQDAPQKDATLSELLKGF